MQCTTEKKNYIKMNRMDDGKGERVAIPKLIVL